MIHYNLIEHTEECENNTSKFYGTKTSLHEFCNRNYKHFLFYFEYDFYLISYHSCLQGYEHHLDFKLSLLNELKGTRYIKEKWKISKSHIYNEKFRKKLIRNLQMNTQIEIINYVYSDNSGKQYCITSKTRFNRDFLNQDLLKENYKKAIDYLEKNNFNNYLDDLKNLFECNYHDLTNFDEPIIINSIDILTKKINNEYKRKSK